MTSRRISFIDIDQSYATAVADSAQTGFMVVRAPKGTAEALYFAKGQSQLIHSMIGIPTADWPDIQDAIDYNNNFGLWISAPAGSSESYPSYFGGAYLTKKGVMPFYNITDKDSLSYLSTVSVGSEGGESGFMKSADIDNCSVSITNNNGTDAHDIITISAPNAGFLPYISKLKFDFWGNPAASGAGTSTAAQILEIYKGTGSDASKLYTLDIDGETPVQVGIIGAGADAGKWILGGSVLAVSTATHYINFAALTSSSDAPTIAALVKARLAWIVDVEDEAYMAISQKSPTEKPTTITFSNVGYEKYYYDMNLGIQVVAGGVGTLTSAATAKNASGYYLAAANALNATPVLYQVVGTASQPVSLTKFRTKYIKVGYDLTSPATETSAAFLERIYYVNTAGVLKLCGVDADYKLDPSFNTVTFKVEEEVYPGKMQSGGTFTGSLNESGVDTYGAKNYFKEILPDEANTFVEVTVKKTFNSDLSSKGIYTGYKVADARDYLGSSSLISVVSGTRYMTSMVEAFVAAGGAGSQLSSEVETALLEGWVEAQANKYEECGVFMDPSGSEQVQEKQYALRQSFQKLSTFISTKKITAAEALDPSTIYVVGRSAGIAQYVNEFLRKDGYTGKKFWSPLIGAMGSKLSRIMELKLGGWTPMYTDIAGGLGGQLLISVEKAKYSFSDDQLKAFEALALNPLILGSGSLGVIAEGQRTTLDPINTSDWSYLGHSMAFDHFKREVRDAVMIPQIGKPNDEYFQGLRQRQTETILNKRIAGLNPIWAKGTVEIANVNTADVKAARQFKIKVSVKVNIFSEWVILELVTLPQGISV